MRKFVEKKSSEALDWLSAVITSVSVGGKWEIRYLKKAHTNENVLRGYYSLCTDTAKFYVYRIKIQNISK